MFLWRTSACVCDTLWLLSASPFPSNWAFAEGERTKKTKKSVFRFSLSLSLCAPRDRRSCISAHRRRKRRLFLCVYGRPARQRDARTHTHHRGERPRWKIMYRRGVKYTALYPRSLQITTDWLSCSLVHWSLIIMIFRRNVMYFKRIILIGLWACINVFIFLNTSPLGNTIAANVYYIYFQ